jgi:hypothetical protein
MGLVQPRSLDRGKCACLRKFPFILMLDFEYFFGVLITSNGKLAVFEIGRWA